MDNVDHTRLKSSASDALGRSSLRESVCGFIARLPIAMMSDDGFSQATSGLTGGAQVAEVVHFACILRYIPPGSKYLTLLTSFNNSHSSYSEKYLNKTNGKCYDQKVSITNISIWR
ncbi:unnamed protein product [Urochloa humidicola]